MYIARLLQIAERVILDNETKRKGSVLVRKIKMIRSAVMINFYIFS